jgi:hypothetical protein
MKTNDGSTERSTEEQATVMSAGITSAAHIGAELAVDVSTVSGKERVDITLEGSHEDGRVSVRFFAEPEEAIELVREVEEAANRAERERGYRWRCAACDALLVDEEEASRHNTEEHGGISSMVDL